MLDPKVCPIAWPIPRRNTIGRTAVSQGRIGSRLRMRIHTLTTGTARLKHAFLFASTGLRRQLDLFLPGPLVGPRADPLLGGRARRAPAARGHRRERPRHGTSRSRASKWSPHRSFREPWRQPACRWTMLRGRPHPPSRRPRRRTPSRARARADQRRRAAIRRDRIPARDAPRPAPAAAAGFAPRPFALDGGPFGAFQRSRALTDDGRIVAVDTPGHAPVTSR